MKLDCLPISHPDEEDGDQLCFKSLTIITVGSKTI
jgi:hypothetical protein